jgi:hypothetical protein
MANDHLLRITVGLDGGVGTIVDSVGFMRLRASAGRSPTSAMTFPAAGPRSASTT